MLQAGGRERSAQGAPPAPALPQNRQNEARSKRRQRRQQGQERPLCRTSVHPAIHSGAIALLRPTNVEWHAAVVTCPAPPRPCLPAPSSRCPTAVRSPNCSREAMVTG